MQQLIEILKKDVVITFEPVDEKALKFVDIMLKNVGLGQLPSDYIDFLKITNGLSWNGIELYGTKAHEREGKEYTFPGLVNVNMDFIKTPALAGKIVVGRVSEGLLIYDIEHQCWQALDRYTFSVMIVTSTLKELLTFFVEGIY